MPMHFAESRANLLTNDAGDSVTGTGEYKVCAIRVEKIKPRLSRASFSEVPITESVLNEKQR